MEKFFLTSNSLKGSICPYKDIYISVHKNLICNSQKKNHPETLPKSITRRMDKLIVIYP